MDSFQFLKEKDNFKMSIRLIWLTIYLSQGFGRAQLICMNKEVNGNNITVNCTVNTFLTNTDLIFPNNIGGAFCSVPGPKHSDPDGDCKCNLTIPGHCNITQNTATKTTTIQISNTSFPGIFGWYTCAHGSFIKSIMVERHCACRPDNAVDIIYKTNYLIGASILGTFGLASIIWTCVYANVLCRWWKKVSHYFFSNQNQTDVNTTHTLCDTCKSSLVCEVCIDCDQRLCDSCCVHHNKSNQDHRVCQVQHIAPCQVKIDCTECNVKPADRVCIECCTPQCKSCGHCLVHGEKSMRKIYEGTLDSIVKSTETVNKFLEETETILVPNMPKNEGKFPVRICGMAFLENGTLTLADTNNNNLIVFHPQNRLNVLTKKLQDQPRSMTSMTGSEIAITFPYDQKIQIYKIVLDENEDTMKVEEVKKIYLPDINLRDIGLPNQRPFSITFDKLDKGFFAVEVGEGVDGIIAIIENNETNSIKRTINPNAFFTGHTIRLALDMSNGGKLYISALGTKMVSCIDLDSREQWSTSIPSPRSIILIPEEYNPGKRIILSSRRCNAIYGLSHKTGKSDILRGIKSPRYMAYYEKEKKLCVQVENTSNIDMLVIFELTFPENIKSTIPLLTK